MFDPRILPAGLVPPTQLCSPRSPFPSIKPLTPGRTSKPAERAQVRPPSQVTADSFERDRSRSKASECKRGGNPPFWAVLASVLSPFLRRRRRAGCDKRAYFMPPFLSAHRSTMADTMALWTSFSLRPRHHTGALRWWRASRVRRNPLGAHILYVSALKRAEPAPLIPQHPPRTITQTDRGSFIIRRLSPDCSSDVTSSPLGSQSSSGCLKNNRGF